MAGQHDPLRVIMFNPETIGPKTFRTPSPRKYCAASGLKGVPSVLEDSLIATLIIGTTLAPVGDGG